MTEDRGDFRRRNRPSAWNKVRTGRVAVSIEPRAGGREIVKLGVWEVGEVRPWPYGRTVHAQWLLALPPASVSPRPAASMVTARRALLFAISDWLDGAGDQARADAVRAQADDLYEAAA